VKVAESDKFEILMNLYLVFNCMRATALNDKGFGKSMQNLKKKVTGQDGKPDFLLKTTAMANYQTLLILQLIVDRIHTTALINPNNRNAPYIVRNRTF
jgi:hypothetical protein